MMHRVRHHLLLSFSRSVVMGFGLFFIASILSVVIAVISLYIYLAPHVDRDFEKQLPVSSKVYAADGTFLHEIYGEYRRTPVTLDQVSPYVKEATLAAEDKDFYQHGAVAWTSVLRAIWINYTHGEIKQGASTISQQVVKNALLTTNRNYLRKAKEALLAHKLELVFSKDEILNLYLNTVPYGRNAYGIQSASYVYFGKSAKDLTLNEAAYLAALPQGTSLLSPDDPDGRKRLEDRKNYILDTMLASGTITRDDYVPARTREASFLPNKATLKYPYFTFWVERELTTQYGRKALEENGFEIHTSLDPQLQDMAEKVVLEYAQKNGKLYHAYNGALVAVNPENGRVLAMVGGKDYYGPKEPTDCIPGKNCLFEPNTNVATSQRQPGSSFKPYTYVTAFGPDFKFSPASLVVDAPVSFPSGNGRYTPRNYSGGYYGRLSVRQALAGSLNVPAVKMQYLVGTDNVIKTAKSLGITSPLQNCGLSLTLGSCEVRLVDHVTAYSVFANGGVRNGSGGVLELKDKFGNLLISSEPKHEQVLDPQAVYELVSIMTDNNARSYIFGANSPLAFKDQQVAAKTGTTNNWHDAWTMGFTPNLAVGVWVGNNNGELLKPGSDGVFAAAPMWRAFMDLALPTRPKVNFPIPPQIKTLKSSDLPYQVRGQYLFKNPTEVFADYAVPDGKPKPSVAAQKKEEKKAEEAAQPKISITSPIPNQSIFSFPATVQVEATSPVDIEEVSISVDGGLVDAKKDDPYTFSISSQLSTGYHTLSARVVDSSGNVATTSIPFNVSGP